MISMSISYAVGHGFMPQLGHTKDHHENATKCLLLELVVCGSTWRHALLRTLGTIARVGYYILVPNYYQVLHGLQQGSYRKLDIIYKDFSTTFQYQTNSISRNIQIH